jgi:hypothetical protein
MGGVVVFQGGGTGPVIRFLTGERRTLLKLRDLCLELVRGGRASFGPADLDGVRFANLDVTFELVEGPRVALDRVSARGEKPVFALRNTRSGWRDCVHFIDALLESDEPGHQYLSDAAIDDAEFVLSYRADGADVPPDVVAEHRRSSWNRDPLAASGRGACFSCGAFFDASEIVEWIDEDEAGVGQTALCPRCGIDAVLPSRPDIDADLLARMRLHWFR